MVRFPIPAAVNPMLFLGVLSVLQITIIPGWLGLKLAGWRAKSPLQFLVYAFAASLLFNFCFVYLLTGLELYSRGSAFALLAAEACAGLWLLKRQGFALRSRIDLAQWTQGWVEAFGLKRFTGCLLFGLALASLLSYTNLLYQNLGTVFTQWDDTVSWDRWAEEWASNHFPTLAGYYPQLMPMNWSLTYQFIGNTDVKMFAKAVMPLFPIATLLLFLDLAYRHRSLWRLFAATIYACVVYTFISGAVIVSGYMETALPFFGFLTLYALLELSENGPTRGNVLAASVFAAGTALVKQGGLYMMLVAAVWTGVVLYRRRAELAAGELGRMVAIAAVALILIVPWYTRQYIAVVNGHDDSNVTRLFALAAQGRTRVQTAAGAMVMLYNCRQDFAKPFLWFLILTAIPSLADSKGRVVLLCIMVPVLLLWAMFFSYEVRTVSLAFPFMAYCSGAGCGVLARLPGRGGMPRKRPAALAFVAAVGCLLVLFAALHFPTLRTAITAGWEAEHMNEIRSVWAMSLLGGAVLVAVVGLTFARRQFAVTLNWYYAVPVAAWLWFGTTSARTADIVARQIELQKNIEAETLNRALYAVLEKEGFQGKVATDYWIFGRLPVLKHYYVPKRYPLETSVEYLKEAASLPGVCYLLVDEARLSRAAKGALDHGLFHTMFIDSRRRFIKTCGDSRTGK
jgi:hypothetical protein